MTLCERKIDLIRNLENSLIITIFLILSITLISMQNYINELNKWEEEHLIAYEKSEISVREEFQRDIMEMEVPEYLLQNEEKTFREEIEDCVTIVTVETETVTTNKNYTQSDVELLARLMYAEEGIFISKLPLEDAKYVNQLAGSVVLHRLNSSFDGCKTIRDVIYEPGQYDCVNRGTINQEIPDIELEWARELLENGPIGPENMVFQAEFKQGSGVYEHIGNQYFCVK